MKVSVTVVFPREVVIDFDVSKLCDDNYIMEKKMEAKERANFVKPWRCHDASSLIIYDSDLASMFGFHDRKKK